MKKHTHKNKEKKKKSHNHLAQVLAVIVKKSMYIVKIFNNNRQAFFIKEVQGKNCRNQ